jgi:hypothetical protein
MASFLNPLRDDQRVTLYVKCNPLCDHYERLKTNLWHKLVYNIDQALHQMAIIKTGVREIARDVRLGTHFGIAVSGLRYSLCSGINCTH